MCELAEGESAEVHIESHDRIQCSLNSRIVKVFLVCAEWNESSPSLIPLAVNRYSAGRDIGGSGQEPRSRLGIVQSRCCDNGWIVLGGGRVGMLQ